jgi:oligopeptidase B
MPRDAEIPVAPVESVHRTLHGDERIDDYAWMRQADDPRLAAYLGAERRHYDVATGHLERLRTDLFDEVERRIPPTESSVSWRRGDCFYYTRTVTGSDYEQFLSSRNKDDAGTVLLDGADFAETSGYVEIGVRSVSPDGRVLAYSVDTTGDEVYTLRYRDLATLRDLPDAAPRSYYSGAWSADSRTFFYTVHDELYRPYQVWRHTLGSAADSLVYQEDDARFDVEVRESRSGAYVFLEVASRDTTETWLVSALSPDADPRVVRPRERGVEYRVDHCRETDRLYVTTNLGAVEFRLMSTPAATPGAWTQDAAARPGERLHACEVLRDHLVLRLRRDGFPLLRVVDRATGTEREVTSATEAGTITLATPFEYGATAVTVRSDSLVAPALWEDVELASGSRTPRKVQDVPGYDASAYRTRRGHATAPDGTAVPYTMAWRDGTPLDGTAPALLWGYGAYESCDDPSFDPMLPSLLDRGVVYVLTHPRGGGENGRGWWLDGHLAAKENTFGDHLAVATHVADAGLVDGTRIATRGLSAGGLLQAVVYTRAPRRWRAVVAEVPFVDVVTTMLDPDIPLTVNEWDEWGDPRRTDDYGWLRAYSPYDNVVAGDRPALLVTGAVHDPRVMVHEPAKWVARLRATAEPSDGPVLFRVELGAGAHTGPSGRYGHFRYEAEVLAWVLASLGAASD